MHCNWLIAPTVALRKESVDRNRCSIKCAICRIKSLSARRAWIEITGRSVEFHLYASLSARRAWIEIDSDVNSASGTLVALRKESVDRNSIASASFRACIVALRKESVDRNSD